MPQRKLYAVLTLTALVFTAVLVLETKRRSLEEIEDALEGQEAPAPVTLTTTTRRAA